MIPPDTNDVSGFFILSGSWCNMDLWSELLRIIDKEYERTYNDMNYQEERADMIDIALHIMNVQHHVYVNETELNDIRKKMITLINRLYVKYERQNKEKWG